MQVALYRFEGGWEKTPDPAYDSDRTLVLMFGEFRDETVRKAAAEVCRLYPRAVVAGCSGAGLIFERTLSEEALVVAVVRFAHSRIRRAVLPIESAEESYRVGEALAEALYDEELRGVLVLSEGIQINGTALTAGLNAALPAGVVVSGGLAGDGIRFEKSHVLDEACRPMSRRVSAVGFYGDRIHVASAHKGGWDRFGPEREITRARENVLYTLGGEPALDVYRRYLGKHARDLPASALLFPLAVREREGSECRVRTVLAIDEKERSITFAGAMPEGGYATFMKANFDRLIDGASVAAEKIGDYYDIRGEALSIAVSCVGRKLLLKERTEEELDATLAMLPPGTRQIGFYSYGEISPLKSGTCDLHNQTMTLTVIWED